MKILLLSLSLCATLFLSGCFGASDNPREGGLFGYSPDAYQQRQDERRSILQGVEAQTEEEKAISRGLEQERSSRQATITRQEKELKAIDSELAATSRKLNALKTETADGEKKLIELKARHASLSAAKGTLEKSRDDTGYKQREIERLQRELRKLEEEADALSRM